MSSNNNDDSSNTSKGDNRPSPSWGEFNDNSAPLNDFKIVPEPEPELLVEFEVNPPPENNDIDAMDPEDPLQRKSNQKQVIGPQLPSSMLPKIVQQRSDEQSSLPSLVCSQETNDFEDADAEQPCSSSGQYPEERNLIIGPTLPAELHKMNHHDDECEFGSGIPPDEPQCSSQSNVKKSHLLRKQKAQELTVQFGPSLPSSCDEEEEEEGESDGAPMIGPMPPEPGRTEDEEQLEYFSRLTQFSSVKQAESKELKREEWMTQLPQKMLKTGAYGLTTKTSFSRTNAASTSSKTDLWTKVQNGNSDKQQPDDSKTRSGTATKRPSKDEWEEQRANLLNKGRDESLLDMHQKKCKLDQSSSSSDSLIVTETGQRKPFNRDAEIEARCFRGQQGKGASGLKEKMGDLAGRFGHGTERKFL